MNITSKDKKVLEELVKLYGPCGDEQAVQDFFSELMRPYVTEVEQDILGNCYARINGNTNAPKTMIGSHADIISFMIKYIDKRGWIFTQNVANCEEVDHTMLPGTKVIIHGRKKGELIPGVFVPPIPVHRSSDLDEKTTSREDLAIDILAISGEQVKRHLMKGDYVVFEVNPHYSSLNGNGRFRSANIDDRIGLFCMYKMAKELKKYRGRKGPISFVSTVTEESGDSTAGIATIHENPYFSITLDCTTATDQIREDDEDTVAKRDEFIELDGGVVLSTGANTDRKMFEYLEKLCLGGNKKHPKIPYQIEVGDGGGEAENSIIRLSGKGSRVALISAPTRYCHTDIETVSLKDVKNVVELCLEFYKNVSRGKFK